MNSVSQAGVRLVLSFSVCKNQKLKFPGKFSNNFDLIGRKKVLFWYVTLNQIDSKVCFTNLSLRRT